VHKFFAIIQCFMSDNHASLIAFEDHDLHLFMPVKNLLATREA
jgi:hypothetical protein